jgi:NADPH-dependent 2,4-dienoyl-CoA reductase/sulfur reductase-like enzyme
VIVGIGAKPAIGLAEQAGLAIDRGVTVDQYLETNTSGHLRRRYLARWPDPAAARRSASSIG